MSEEKESEKINDQKRSPTVEVEVNPDISFVDKEATDQIVKGFGISIFCSYLISSGLLIGPYLPPPSNDALFVYIISYLFLIVTVLFLLFYSFCLFASAARRIYLAKVKNNDSEPSIEVMKSLGGVAAILFLSCSVIVGTSFFIGVINNLNI